MIEKRGASPLFLTAGLALLLAYFFISHLMYRFSGADHPWIGAVSAFFSPGYVNAPGQWLLGELIEIGMAVAGLTCLAIAAVPRRAWRASLKAARSLRGGWCRWIWAVLLGGCGIGLAFTLLDLIAPRGFERDRALFEQVGYWAGSIRLACGAIVSARLLFAQQRRSYEKWLGYVFAALALYALAWALLRVLGLDLNAALMQGDKARPLLLRLWDESFGIAFSSASAWTGLFMARRRSFVASTVPAAPAVVYLCAASLLFYLALPRTFGMWRIFQEVGPIAIGCGAASLSYFAFTFLASLHAARLGMVLPSVEATQPAPMRDVSWRQRLLIETPIGLAVSLVLMGGGYFFVSKIDVIALAFLMPLATLLLFVGPILVFIYGLLRDRSGYSIGAALLALGLFGYREMNLMQASEHAKAAVAEATNLNLYPFQAPKQAHKTVLVTDSLRDSVERAGCSERCRLVLLTSSYGFAVEDPAKSIWHVLHLVRDRNTCRTPENRPSMLQFMGAGYPDTCAVETIEAPGTDALVIRENVSDKAPIYQQFPKGFRGSAFEFFERIDGKDTLLGRVVWGGVQPPLLSNQEVERTSAPLNDKEFYAVVLKLPGSALPPITADNAKAAIPIYVEMLIQPDDGSVRNSWTAFTMAPQEPGATEVLRGAIVDLMTSEDPARVKIGVSTISSQRSRGLDFIKPAVLQLLAAGDVARMKSGVSALFSFKLTDYAADLDFAKDHLGTIVVGDGLKAYAREPGNLLEILKLVRGSYPEAERKAALAVLAAPEPRTDTELLALLSVAAHGGPEHSAEAAAVVFAMPEPKFQQTIAATAFKGDLLTGDLANSLWSETDVAEIARRASAVPNPLLANYIRSIQFSRGFNEKKSAIKALIDERLVDQPADSEVARNFQRLRDDL